MTLPPTSRFGTPRFELVDEIELGLNSTLAATLLQEAMALLQINFGSSLKIGGSSKFQ